MTAAIDYAARTVKIYRGNYDAAARAAIAEHVADAMNPHATTKLQIGLGNVQNLSPAAMPISDATAAALALKAALASPALTGTPTAPTAPLGTVTTQIASTAFVQGAVNAADVPAVAADLEAHVGRTDNPHAVDKADVGLSNVADLAPADLPISNATQTALSIGAAATADVADDLAAHTANTNNPHGVDKTDVGLGNVANLAPADLPISNATQAALNTGTAATAAVAGDLDLHEGSTSNPHAVTKAQVGLAAADNTADLNKPISSATQVALNLKAPLASPSLTGAPTAPTAASGTSTTQLATTAFVTAADAIVAGGAAAAQADADEALAAAAAAQEDADQAILDAAGALGAAEAAQSDADAAQSAAAAAQADADAAQATADEALADAAAAQEAADAAQATADEALRLIGQAAAVYGSSKTGSAAAATPIDPAWIVTAGSTQVVRVDAAVAADPQTVALVPAMLMEVGHTYTVGWKVRRQTNPIDPLNDSVILGLQWMTDTYAANGAVTIDAIALVIADGTEERTARIALAPFADAAEVDHAAPPGTLYFRPYVDLYGGSHVTDVTLDGGGGIGSETDAIAHMYKDASNSTELAIESLITAAAARPAHGNDLLTQPALLSRTLVAQAGDALNLRDYAVGNNAIETTAIQAFFDDIASKWYPVSPEHPLGPADSRMNPDLRLAEIPGGMFRTADATIVSGGYGWSVKGHGVMSQLVDTTLEIAHNETHIESLRLSSTGSRRGVGVQMAGGQARLFDLNVTGKATGIRHSKSAFIGGFASNPTIFGGWLRDNDVGASISLRDYRAFGQRITGGNIGYDYFDEGGIELVGCNSTTSTGPSFLVRGSHIRFRGDLFEGSPIITNITEVAGDYASLKKDDVVTGALFIDDEDFVPTSALPRFARIVTVTPTTITLDQAAEETLGQALLLVVELPWESYFVGNTFGFGGTQRYPIISIERANTRIFTGNTYGNTHLDNINPPIISSHPPPYGGQFRMYEGQVLEGPAFAAGTTVAAVISTTAVTLSQPALISATGTQVTVHDGTLITLATEHRLTKYLGGINLEGTGQLFYDDTINSSAILAVPSSTSVVLSLPYAGPLITSGTAQLAANEDACQYLTTAPSNASIRNMFTVAGNQNGSRFKGGANFGFVGTRLKVRKYMHGCRPFRADADAASFAITNMTIPASELRIGTHITAAVLPPFTRVVEILGANSIRVDKAPMGTQVQALIRSPEQTNGIVQFVMPDDQVATGTKINPPTGQIRNSDQPYQGPGSLIGWCDFGGFRNGVSGYEANEGGFFAGMRCAYTQGGLQDNQPKYLQELGITNNAFHLITNAVQYDIQGQNFRVGNGVLNFEEAASTADGVNYRPLGLPMFTTTRAYRSYNDQHFLADSAVGSTTLTNVSVDTATIRAGQKLTGSQFSADTIVTGFPSATSLTISLPALLARTQASVAMDVLGNAIHRWAAPKLDTAPGGSLTAAYAVVPGSEFTGSYSFFLGACTDNPALIGDAASLRKLQSSIEIMSRGQVSLWHDNAEYLRWSGYTTAESFYRIDQDDATRLTIQNWSTGANAIASLGVRNGAGVEAGFRLIVSGTAFTNGGAPLAYLPADASALVSGTQLSNGMSLVTLAGDMRFYVGPAPTPTLVMRLTPTGAAGTSLALSGTAPGTLTVGGVPPTVGGGPGQISFMGTTAGGSTSDIVGSRFVNSAAAPGMRLGKSRGTITVPGAVLAGDTLGDIGFYGDDGAPPAGTIPVLGTQIRAVVEGTVSAGVVPAGIAIRTMNQAGGTADRARFFSSGGFAVGTAPTTDPGPTNAAIAGSLMLGADVILQRGAANRLEIRNGTSPQGARLYNTFTDSTNNEWCYMGSWLSNAATYGSSQLGTGIARDVSFVRGGVEVMRMVAGGLQITTGGIVGKLGVGTASPVGNLHSASTGGAGVDHLLIEETDAAADTRFWSMTAQGGNLILRIFNDSMVTAIPVLTFARTGMSVAAATFNVPVVQRPPASVTPANNGDMMIQATSNTQLTFRLKGSDGVVRSGNLALA
ncbi:MAG TPA: hypothetical protein VEW06_06445 [Xanthobacteraceae bacterium]|nr:hypothetical protein [Xanthobacteraceae bacterium]